MMPSTILFLCPHGAAKSVLAAAYFQQFAAQDKLPFQADFAGTEPSVVIAPAVLAFLAEQGLPIPAGLPRRVSTDDLRQAERVISLGCERADLPGAPHDWETWDDVPPPSQNLAASSAAIRQHVEHLINQLKAAYVG